MPEICVLLPVYNDAENLREALTSLTRQTFRDFQVLVLDDASSDGSAEVAERLGDPRVRVVRNAANLKLAGNLNQGLQLADARFLARLDSDDLCHPRRLELQREFLLTRPALTLAGTWFRVFGQGRSFVCPKPVGTGALRVHSLFDNPLCHPSVMARAEPFRAAGLRYDPAWNPVEDYELWLRALDAGLRADNLPLPLVNYRLRPGSMTRSGWSAMSGGAATLVRAALGALDITLDDETLALHLRLGRGDSLDGPEELSRALDHLRRLESFLPEPGRERCISSLWFHACRNARLPLAERFALWRRQSWSGGLPLTAAAWLPDPLGWRALRKAWRT